MVLQRNNDYIDKTPVSLIHKQFPYKYYLKILGNNSLGDYIAVISDSEIKENELQHIELTLEDSLMPRKIIDNTFYIGYKTKLINIVDIMDKSMYIFNVRER